MKKILSLLLTAGVLISTVTAALAAAPSDRALFDVKSLGIMQGDENGDMQLGKELTRAEFATVILNLEGMKEVANMIAYKQKFADVNENEWYAKVITYVTDQNIMIGCSETEFCPNNAVTLEQAVKTLVVALGYDSMAVAKGGYPNGYMMQGESLGLMKSLNVENGMFTRGDLVTLLYNALDINRLAMETTSGGGEKLSATGETFREELTSDRKQNQLSQGSGVVNATYAYWLTEPDSTMNADEVMIGKQIYKIGETDAEEYLGMQVDYYAKENDNGTYTLQSIRPKDRKNEKQQINSEDIKTFTASQLIYYPDGGKNTKTLKITSGATIVRNGEVQTVLSDSVFDIANGIVTWIDNDGDSNADVIIIDDYTDVVVDSVKGNVAYFINNQKYQDKKYFKPETNSVTNKYIIQDADGNYIDMKDIKAGSVMSIFTTADKSYYKVIVSDRSAEGTLTATDDTYLTIGGVQYKHSNLNIGVKTGRNIKAYINFRGLVCYVEEGENVTNDYGYIIKTWENDDGANYIRVLKGAVIREDIEKDNQDQEADEIPVLICQNESVMDYRVSDRLSMDGSKYDTDNLSGIIGKVCEVSVNKENEVTRLESLDLAGGRAGTGLVFNVKNRTFGSVSGVNSFAIDSNTKAICVPKEDTGNKEDYMVQVKLDNTDSTRKYIVQGYEMNTETNKVKLMVVTESMKASSVTNVNIDTCKIGFVTDSYTYWDETLGDTKPGISVLVSGVNKKYETVDLSDANQHLENLKKGDLIFFAESNTGKLENAVIMQNITDNMEDFFDKNPDVSELRQKGYYTICGDVVDVLYDQVKDVSSESTNYIADEVVVDVDGSERSLYLKQISTPPIFLYEAGQTYDAQNITSDDIIPGEDRVFAIITNEGLVKACVVIRNA